MRLTVARRLGSGMALLVLVILAMVAFILFAESSPVLPFVYTVI